MNGETAANPQLCVGCNNCKSVRGGQKPRPHSTLRLRHRLSADKAVLRSA